MADEGLGQVDRRQLIGSGLVLSALIGTPLWFWQRMRSGDTGEATDADRLMLDTLSDIVIPRTDTPGGSDVSVGDFVVLALNHGLEGTRDPGASAAIQGANERPTPHGGMFLLDDLAIRLRIKAGGDFNAAGPERQRAAVEAVDAQAFAPGGEKDAWHQIKNLILTGYYTSEAGGSKELNYELVPGRWDADIPLKPADRAYSSDWTAVDFG